MCLECEENNNLTLDSFTNLCGCSNGYKKNKFNICEKCLMYSNKCFSKCPGNTEIDS